MVIRRSAPLPPAQLARRLRALIALANRDLNPFARWPTLYGGRAVQSAGSGRRGSEVNLATSKGRRARVNGSLGAADPPWGLR